MLKQNKISQLTIEEHVFISEKNIGTKSFITVKRQFRSRFNHKSPCKTSIQNKVAKYCSLYKNLKINKKEFWEKLISINW